MGKTILNVKCKQKGERKKKANTQKKEYKCNIPEEQKRYKCKQGDKNTKNTKEDKGKSEGAKKRYKYKQPKPTRKANVFVCLHLYHFFYVPPDFPLSSFVFFFDVFLSPCLHLYLSFFAPLECYICIPLSLAVSFFFPPFVYICGLGCRVTWNVTFVNREIHL